MTKRRRREAMETPEYINDFAARVIRRAGVRVADGDPTEFADLVALRGVLDEAIAVAAGGMRARHGYSWDDIARELGVTRQAAHARYAKMIRARAGADTMPT